MNKIHRIAALKILTVLTGVVLATLIVLLYASSNREYRQVELDFDGINKSMSVGFSGKCWVRVSIERMGVVKGLDSAAIEVNTCENRKRVYFIRGFGEIDVIYAGKVKEVIGVVSINAEDGTVLLNTNL